MGYYTRHELVVVVGDNSLIEEFRGSCEGASYAISENGDGEESCKWYDHAADMKKFSILHPEALFKLSGECEESGDIWREYYQNGKMQLCKANITFADFDLSLLK